MVNISAPASQLAIKRTLLAKMVKLSSTRISSDNATDYLFISPNPDTDHPNKPFVALTNGAALIYTNRTVFSPGASLLLAGCYKHTILIPTTTALTLLREAAALPASPENIIFEDRHFVIPDKSHLIDAVDSVHHIRDQAIKARDDYHDTIYYGKNTHHNPVTNFRVDAQLFHTLNQIYKAARIKSDCHDLRFYFTEAIQSTSYGGTQGAANGPMVAEDANKRFLAILMPKT